MTARHPEVPNLIWVSIRLCSVGSNASRATRNIETERLILYDRQANRPVHGGIRTGSPQNRALPRRAATGGLREYRPADRINLSLGRQGRIEPRMAAADQDDGSELLEGKGCDWRAALLRFAGMHCSQHRGGEHGLSPVDWRVGEIGLRRRGRADSGASNRAGMADHLWLPVP